MQINASFLPFIPSFLVVSSPPWVLPDLLTHSIFVTLL